MCDDLTHADLETRLREAQHHQARLVDAAKLMEESNKRQIAELQRRVEALEGYHEEVEVQMDRLHQELQERPEWKDLTWRYANDLLIRLKIQVKAALRGSGG